MFKITKLIAAGFAALTLASGAAFATPVPTNVNLDPSLSQAGNSSETVCDGAPFPPCGVLNGPSQFTVTFANPGLFSSSITASVVGGGFTVLNYTIKDPSNTVIFSNITAQNSASVVAGVYTIIVNWSYTGVPGNSANWTVSLTTGPALRVPEPGTLALLGLGLAVLGFTRRRKA